MTLWIGAESGTDDIPSFGGEYSSFLVGQRMLGVQKYIPVTTEGDSEEPYDEVARVFERMNGDGLSPYAEIDVAQYLMTNGGTYFAPLSGVYRTTEGNVPMMSRRVTYSDGSSETFSQGSYLRTVGEPNGKAIEDVEPGDRPLSARGKTVASVSPVVQDGTNQGISYTRASFDWDYAHGQERYNSFGSEDAASIGLSFRVYQQDSDRGYVFFDDSRLETSNVLWEFSTDSGTHWTPYFAMPNKPYTRVSLPGKTNQVRVRAQSSTDTEWIRGYSIMPLTSMRNMPKMASYPDVEVVTPMRWEVIGSVNSPIFTYEDGEGNEVRTRRFALPQGGDETLSGDVSMTYYYGQANDCEYRYNLSPSYISRTTPYIIAIGWVQGGQAVEGMPRLAMCSSVVADMDIDIQVHSTFSNGPSVAFTVPDGEVELLPSSSTVSSGSMQGVIASKAWAASVECSRDNPFPVGDFIATKTGDKLGFNADIKALFVSDMTVDEEGASLKVEMSVDDIVILEYTNWLGDESEVTIEVLDEAVAEVSIPSDGDEFIWDDVVLSFHDVPVVVRGGSVASTTMMDMDVLLKYEDGDVYMYFDSVVLAGVGTQGESLDGIFMSAWSLSAKREKEQDVLLTAEEDSDGVVHLTCNTESPLPHNVASETAYVSGSLVFSAKAKA